MEIFGFSITRVSKKDKAELEVFTNTVKRFEDCISRGRTILESSEFELPHVQMLAEIQEELECLVDIYSKNKFAKPATHFSLVDVVGSMGSVYKNYAHACGQIARLREEAIRFDEMKNNKTFPFGEQFAKLEGEAIKRAHEAASSNYFKAFVDYQLSLNALRFNITYDVTRIETGVDIISDYYKSKKQSLDDKRTLFHVKFKTLSRDEVKEQINSKLEKKKEDECHAK